MWSEGERSIPAALAPCVERDVNSPPSRGKDVSRIVCGSCRAVARQRNEPDDAPVAIGTGTTRLLFESCVYY